MGGRQGGWDVMILTSSPFTIRVMSMNKTWLQILETIAEVAFSFNVLPRAQFFKGFTRRYHHLKDRNDTPDRVRYQPSAH